MTRSLPRAYLVAGTLEPFFHDNATPVGQKGGAGQRVRACDRMAGQREPRVDLGLRGMRPLVG